MPESARRPRALRLRYEGPSKPGAGGGSVPTHEIDRRLATEHDIAMARARFRGAQPYQRHGVRLLHIGAGHAHPPAVMTCFATQRRAVRRWAPDLVVQGLGASRSTWGLPALVPQHVVGVVRWLFAKEKAHQYHLPFATPEPVNRSHIAYLGHLEDAQKGVTLLMHAYAGAVAAGASQQLHIAGVGPDEAMLRDLARRLRITDRIQFLGHMPVLERFARLTGDAAAARQAQDYREALRR